MMPASLHPPARICFGRIARGIGRRVSRPLLLLWLVAGGIRADAPDFSAFKVNPMLFPTAPAGFAPLSLDAVGKVSSRLNGKIGRYPPQLDGPGDRQHTYVEWSQAMLSVEQWHTKSGLTEPIAVLSAALYREGHNLDVKECGEKALTVLAEGLKAFPDSVPLNFEASYFYLQIDPKFAPRGEAALLRLRRLLKTDKNLDVERGLVFAYLYENKLRQAKKQLARCLELAPGDPVFTDLQKALQAGAVNRIND